jgi:MtN3 and saliva related transmembrane protein
MNGIQILGLVAGFLTTIAFVPQVVKTWKSKSAKDISLNMFLLFCLGVSLWLIYGIINNDLPIILANLMTLLLALCILYFKLRYK